jgi:lipopolysaccharide transport system ATP-binding protein
LGASHASLASGAKALMRRVLRRRRFGDDDAFWALRDLCFAVGPGEALGIIGPNGAGKSTALKLLAGILRPDEGDIDVRGRVAALIEVGAGFHGDLTGRENVYLNGAILGMTRGEIRRKFDDIVAFAGIEAFLDMPVKRYSSGMYARLGFSIAAHVEPDVLLVDEVLSVGDAMFRLRCEERMQAMLHGGTAVVFVTHNLDQMEHVCRRAVVLDSGCSTFVGAARDAVSHYMRAMSHTFTHRRPDLLTDADGSGGDVDLMSLRFLGIGGTEIGWAGPGEPVRCALTLNCRRALPRAVVELNMRASVNSNLLSVNSGRDDRVFACPPGVNRFLLDLPELPFSGGQYFWNVRVWDADRSTTELDTPFRFPLMIDDGGRATGAVRLAHEWSHDTTSAAPRSTVHDSVSALADKPPVAPAMSTECPS